ncbi:hypothetical protein QF042_001371 [Pedobacter sp. W3I1]|uniref:hypothetical protein n=1 Tax=Pedobacter sp. W3I1 TaxID=3042291 RepID=UPI0027894CDA|nr:hypothetical protein [Pedobacter sp. W3I1]MDQ0637806.1 hypothetical protein [Pedobacter sp. W3I1]
MADMFTKPTSGKYCCYRKNDIMIPDNNNEQENKDNLAHEAGHDRSDNAENDNKELEDNELQRGLTGESDDEEDVSGDLAGNAAGNPDE